MRWLISYATQITVLIDTQELAIYYEKSFSCVPSTLYSACLLDELSVLSW